MTGRISKAKTLREGYRTVPDRYPGSLYLHRRMHMSDTFKPNDIVVSKDGSGGSRRQYKVIAVNGNFLWIIREDPQPDIPGANTSGSGGGFVTSAGYWEKVPPLFELGKYRYKTVERVYEAVHLLDGGKRAVILWHDSDWSQYAAIATDPTNYVKVES